MKDRYSNGYKLIYKPDYYLSYKEGNFKGYIYEHIYVVTKALKRGLYPHEVVHHLDFNRTNNERNNLIVLSNTDHSLLHAWINRTILSKKDQFVERYCEYCNRRLELTLKYCSSICRKKHLDTLNEEYKLNGKIIPSEIRPNKELRLNKELLIFTLENCNSIMEVARLYKVSDNAIRKWCRRFNISTKIKDY